MATQTKPTEEKALAIPDRRQELKELVGRYPEDKYILLMPSTEFGFSPMFRPVVSEVRIVAAEGSKDIYVPAGARGGEVALHATALKRISNALAITWEDTKVEETARWKWRAAAAGWILHPNGDRIRISDRYVLDVSDDQAVIVKRIRAKAARATGAARDPREKQKALDDAERDIDSYRQFGEQRAVTGAMSRVIQTAANLQKTYRLDELTKKSFAALHWRPDERHPEVAKALVRRMEHASSEVFGTRELPAEIQGTVHEVDAGEGNEDEMFTGPALEAGEREGSSESAAREAPAERGGTTTEVPGAKPGPRSAEAEPAVPDEPEPVTDIAAIAAEVRAKADGMGNERLQFATKEQLVDLGKGLTELLGLKGKLSDQQRVELRLAVLRAFLGPELPNSSQANRAAVASLIAMLGEEEGRRRIRLVAAAAKAVPA